MDSVEADLFTPIDEGKKIEKFADAAAGGAVKCKEGDADAVVGFEADFLPVGVCFHRGAGCPLKIASRQLSAISRKAPRKPLSFSPLRMVRGYFW